MLSGISESNSAKLLPLLKLGWQCRSTVIAAPESSAASAMRILSCRMERTKGSSCAPAKVARIARKKTRRDGAFSVFAGTLVPASSVALKGTNLDSNIGSRLVCLLLYVKTQQHPRSSMQGDNTSKGALKKSLLDGSDRAQPGAASFRAQVSPVFFLAGLFFLNFASRIILSPLLPTIEKELAISHSQAGFFFFLSSGGYLVGLLSSGVLTSRSSHRLAISASLAGVGIALLTIAAATSLWLIECGLMVLGFAAGFYLPSAIATITSLVDKRHWGKAIAIHELAPNLAFFATPFLAEIFLHWSSWRMGLGLLGVLSLVGSLSFGRFGRGGDFPGESPGSNAFAVLARTPAFWLMMVLFGVGVSSTIGVYAMLPLYLVSQRNFDQSTANTLVAF